MEAGAGWNEFGHPAILTGVGGGLAAVGWNAVFGGRSILPGAHLDGGLEVKPALWERRKSRWRPGSDSVRVMKNAPQRVQMDE